MKKPQLNGIVLNKSAQRNPQQEGVCHASNSIQPLKYRLQGDLYVSSTVPSYVEYELSDLNLTLSNVTTVEINRVMAGNVFRAIATAYIS